MKILGPIKLFILSIIWISVILVFTGHDFQLMLKHPSIQQVDLPSFIQTGLLPVLYLWLVYFSLKLLIPSKKNLM